MAQDLISIPKVHTEDRNVNQLQQNIIDAFRKIQGAIMNLATSIGDVQISMLTEDQFQQQRGTGWVLIDGQSVKGSRYAELTGFDTLPQAGGTVPRFKDNGSGLNPDGDLALGTYQADAFASHTHVQDAHLHTYNASFDNIVAAGPPNSTNAFAASPPGVARTQSSNSTTATNQTTGGNETRGKCITYNGFIRIN